MHFSTLELLRAKLERRWSRIVECDVLHLRFALSRFWGFLHADSYLHDILSELEERNKDVVRIAPGVLVSGIENFEGTKNDEAYVALAYGFWKDAHDRRQLLLPFSVNYESPPGTY